MSHYSLVKHVRLLIIAELTIVCINNWFTFASHLLWFDAAHIPGLLLVQYLHQFDQTILELCGSSWRPLLVVYFTLRKYFANNHIFRITHRLFKVAIQRIVIFIKKSVHIIHNFARIVAESELLLMQIFEFLNIHMLHMHYDNSYISFNKFFGFIICDVMRAEVRMTANISFQFV